MPKENASDARRRFREANRTRSTEAWYRKELRTLARMIDLIASQYKDEKDPSRAAEGVQRELFGYEETLGVWAEAIATHLVKRIADADWQTWRGLGDQINKDVLRQIQDMKDDPGYRQMIEREIDLIKSLPHKAAEKAQEIARKGFEEGLRYDEIVAQIAGLGNIADSRAVLIARTESSRCRTDFTKMRAERLGSTKFIWRTVGDGTVRDSHRKLDGKIFEWANPPVCDYGKGGEPIRALPGAVFNCRCYAEPVYEKSAYED